VGAFEIDLPSRIEAMQLSSASGEAPRAEEHTDSEGIIRRYSRIVSIVSSSMPNRRGRWHQLG
jgi:hypothetical protein